MNSRWIHLKTSTIIYLIAMGWALLIHGGLTYLIVKKKEYSLISGFSNRPKEEQETLIKNGFIDAMGRFLTISFYLFAVTFVAGLLPIPYAFEVGMTIFIVYLLGGLVWMQKYEVPHKRKKMYWTTGILAFITLGIVGGLTVASMLENEVTIEQHQLKISGMYGDEWPIEDVKSVKLLDELPEVIVKTNGFATEGQLKGRFRLEEPYGSGQLFVKGKTGPFLYISTKKECIILNRADPEETQNLYQSLTEQIK